MTYDEALAIVEEARRAFDKNPDAVWGAMYARDLLLAAETISARAKEVDGVGAMLEEALKARGVTRVPSRIGDRVALLLTMAEMAIVALVTEAQGEKGAWDEVQRRWYREAWISELLTNKDKVPRERDDDEQELRTYKILKRRRQP